MSSGALYDSFSSLQVTIRFMTLVENCSYNHWIIQFNKWTCFTGIFLLANITSCYKPPTNSHDSSITLIICPHTADTGRNSRDLCYFQGFTISCSVLRLQMLFIFKFFTKSTTITLPGPELPQLEVKDKRAKTLINLKI